MLGGSQASQASLTWEHTTALDGPMSSSPGAVLALYHSVRWLWLCDSNDAVQ